MLALLLLVAASTAAPENPCTQAKSSATLVSKGEPGTPLRVHGTVYRADGTTPAAGVILYVYQTDDTGVYAKKRGDDPRIRGWMRTDADGRYEFLTIRPAPYPSRTEPAHIHTQIWGTNVPVHSNVVLLFEGDPLIRPKERKESEALGRFGFIGTPVKAPDGIFEVTLDMRIQEKGDDLQESIRHGLRACGVAPGETR
jgi:protocatechuate 3,4-dioxygenase beta subunit